MITPLLDGIRKMADPSFEPDNPEPSPLIEALSDKDVRRRSAAAIIPLTSSYLASEIMQLGPEESFWKKVKAAPSVADKREAQTAAREFGAKLFDISKMRGPQTIISAKDRTELERHFERRNPISGLDKIDPGKRERIKKSLLKIMPEIHSEQGPYFDFANKTIAGSGSLPVMMHEVGHARNAKILGKHAVPWFNITQSGVPLFASTALGGAMAASNSDTANKLAPYVAAAGILPRLVEESSASLYALNKIRKLRGWKAMAKGVPTLSYGLMTQALLPAIPMVTVPLAIRAIKALSSKTKDIQRARENEQTAVEG